MLTEYQKNYIKKNYNLHRLKYISEKLNIPMSKIQSYASRNKLSDIKHNQYEFLDDSVKFLCLKRDNSKIYFYVDKCDFDKVYNFGKWCISEYKKNSKRYCVYSYFKTNNGRKNIKLHRFILGLDDLNKEVDHIDGNPLNNKRNNLRIVNRIQNSQNLHQDKFQKKRNLFKGVGKIYLKNGEIRYRVCIRINGKDIYTKKFKDVDIAIMASKYVYAKYISFSPEYRERDIIIQNTPIELKEYMDKQVEKYILRKELL